jgi:hypothetical protein
MPLEAAERLGGDFLDLKEVARTGPTLAVFRIKEFCAPEPAQGFAGTNVPVIADVWIVDGPRAGEVAIGERLIGAITAPLRGVKNPNPQKGIGVLAPVKKVGAEIVCRLKLVNPGKGNEGVVGDQPGPTEMTQVQAAYAAMGGEQLWANAERSNAESAAQAPAPVAPPAEQQVPAVQLNQSGPATATGNGGQDPAALQAQLAALQAQLGQAQQPVAVGPENGAEARPMWQQAQ